MNQLLKNVNEECPMAEFVTALAKGMLSERVVEMRGVTLAIETAPV
ncbi:MAG: hypothetical protein HYX78_02745 [Armatimonadetes bacterium]|nr:hypothetical protein [Armatimonadota bacterium]